MQVRGTACRRDLTAILPDANTVALEATGAAGTVAGWSNAAQVSMIASGLARIFSNIGLIVGRVWSWDALQFLAAATT